MTQRNGKSLFAGLVASIFAGVLASPQAAAATPLSTEVEAPGPLGPLRGTMLAPAGASRAAMIMVPGSGPTDRDGNNPAGVRAATMRLLAEGLAANGITSIRIDKRGMFGSGGAVADANRVSIPDYVEDVRQWVMVARERTGASCVWVLGHSEGGLVALAAGQQPEGLCGLVLVSTAGRPIGTILREQLRANPANAPLLGQAIPAIDSLEAGRRVDTANLHPALMPLFAPPVQDYLINLMSYDPARLAGSVRLPMLIVQGLRDLQVTQADAEGLAAANSAARLVLLSDTNHVLKAVPADDRAMNAATYGDPSLPLAPGVVEAIAGFVTRPPDAAGAAE